VIVIKSAREIEAMREAGRVVAHVLAEIGRAVQPGVRTRELDALAAQVMARHGAVSADLGYQPHPDVPPYPATICVSVNDEIIHGVPGPRRLVEGDIVSVDVSVIKDGFVGDGAWTFPCGRISEEARRLLEVTEAALAAGLAQCHVGRHVSDISQAVQTVVERAGYSVVRDYCGHGVGRSMHEEPEVPNYGRPGRGPRLQAGMTLAVEPMVNAGGPETVVDRRDGWTVRTRDGSLSAHCEHSVAIRPEGPLVLTLP
jgi:methionyl aminopeptidase